MILIELVGEGPKRFKLEFHPRVSVVAGLTVEQRRFLASSIVQAIGTGDGSISFTVDVNGDPQPLTSDLIARLGFARAPMDNVLEPGDLPGAIIHDDPSLEVPSAEVEDRAEVSPLESARAELKTVQRQLQQIEREIELYNNAAFPVDDRELEYAKILHQAAVARVEELRALRDEASNDGPQLSRSERLKRARAVRETLRSRLQDLKADIRGPVIEPELVEELLLEAQAAALKEEQDVVRAELVANLLTSMDSLEARIERVRETPGPPSWLVAQTKDDLEQAQARVTALSSQLREGIEVDEQLERAQRQLFDARSAWDELQSGALVEDMGALQSELQELHKQAVALLGEDPGDAELRGALVAFGNIANDQRDPRDELVELLAEAGVATSLREAIGAAVKWLDKARSIADHKSKLQKELAAVAVNIQQMDSEIAELEELGELEIVESNVDPLEQLAMELVDAEQEADVATERLTALQDQSARHARLDQNEVARLDYRRRDAAELVAAVERKVDYFARLGALSSEPEHKVSSIADAAVPWWAGNVPALAERAVPLGANVETDLSGVDIDDAEMFVLARAAALRHVGRGESVPLVIDAAFDQLPPEVAARLFEVLPRVAPIVQIVYLAGNDVAEKWAKKQPETIAATVRLERA